MSISVLNTDAGLSAKTIVNAEDAQNVTGAKSFNRSPNPPFVVQAGSAVVPNLDADKLDGQHGPTGPIVGTTDSQTLSSKTLTAPNIDTVNLTGGQITFPAVQNASAGANVLDDYEEGTWTPVIGGFGGTSGQTYSSQVGHYLKIGRFVLVTFNAALTNKGTITGAVQILGLPFQVETLANYIPGGALTHWTNLTTSYVYMAMLGVQASSAASIFAATAATTGLATIATGDLTNTSSFHGTMWYRTTN